MTRPGGYVLADKKYIVGTSQSTRPDYKAALESVASDLRSGKIISKEDAIKKLAALQ